MIPSGSNDPGKLNRNRLVGWLAILAIVIVATLSGYRFHLGPNGPTFEKDAGSIAAQSRPAGNNRMRRGVATILAVQSSLLCFIFLSSLVLCAKHCVLTSLHLRSLLSPLFLAFPL
jgi:hypothetical protein